MGTLSLRVIPRASRNGVAGVRDGVPTIRLTAPPVDDKANAALVAFLSETLGVPKRSIRIVAGERSRRKTIEVDGMEPAAILARLAPEGG
jgi:hypothetical protein